MSWNLGFLQPRRKNIRRPIIRSDRPAQDTRATHVIGNSVPDNWQHVSADEIMQVPGMTQLDELRYFYWCCAQFHRPSRRVVELGPYVGRSTMAMAAGLRRSGEPNGKVVSIDCFRWNPWCLENTMAYTVDGLSDAQRARLDHTTLHPKDGDTFLPIFELYTEPMRDWIEPIAAALETYEWSGEPIDVLLIDAAKSWSALDQIVRQFFPCLTDGAAVMHQDYKHFFTFWLHPVTERMIERGVLTVAENVTGTPTQGFRFNKRRDFRVDDYLQAAFTPEESNRLLSRSVRRFSNDHDRLAVAGARCQLLLSRQQHNDAKAVIVNEIQQGAFADNFALSDAYILADKWVRPMAAELWQAAKTSRAVGNGNASLRKAGSHSIVLQTSQREESFVAVFAPVNTSSGRELVLNFRADENGVEAVRIRVQATVPGQTAPAYDEEFPIAPGRYQTARIPTCDHSQLVMRWTAWSEGPPAVSREVQCVGPSLILG